MDQPPPPVTRGDVMNEQVGSTPAPPSLVRHSDNPSYAHLNELEQTYETENPPPSDHSRPETQQNTGNVFEITSKEYTTEYEPQDDPEILWVNWDGKDDRQNPKKYVS